MANTNTCSCCGCVVADGFTSVVTGSGSSGDPYKIDVLDPLFSVQKFAVRRQRSTSQSILNDTLTEVDFTTAAAGSFDRAPFFVAPSTFTVPTSGIYIFGANVSFLDNANGTRYIEIVKNDTMVLASMEGNSNAGSDHFVAVSSSAKLFGSETLKLRVRQVSGGSLNIVVAAEQSPVFWALYVGRFV